jgi:hypothetical protein
MVLLSFLIYPRIFREDFQSFQGNHPAGLSERFINKMNIARIRPFQNPKPVFSPFLEEPVRQFRGNPRPKDIPAVGKEFHHPQPGVSISVGKDQSSKRGIFRKKFIRFEVQNPVADGLSNLGFFTR